MQISVITINYNNAAGLEPTIISVLSQVATDYEYIIIDGGSTDGSVEVIQAYSQSLSYWVSEPDRGISHAFNKGLDKATGDYILMLNAGDRLLSPNALEKCSEYLDQPIVSFYGKYLNSSRTVPRQFKCQSKDPRKKAQLCHQATFIHQSVYKELKGYSENYKVRMDYEFFLRVVKKWTINCIPEVLVEYSPDGRSSSLKYGRLFVTEGAKAEQSALGKKYPNNFILAFRYLTHFTRIALRKTLLFRY